MFQAKFGFLRKEGSFGKEGSLGKEGREEGTALNVNRGNYVEVCASPMFVAF